MIRHVVDASVAIKWFVEEVHAEAARRLLADVYVLYAPVNSPLSLPAPGIPIQVHPAAGVELSAFKASTSFSTTVPLKKSGFIPVCIRTTLANVKSRKSAAVM